MTGPLRMRGQFGVREGVLEKAGDFVVTHQHNFDHLTYLLGAARVEVLEPKVDEPDPGNPEHWKVLRYVDRDPGGWVMILAFTWHRITALRGHVEYHCIFLHRDPCDPDHPPVSQANYWQTAYE